MIDEVHPNSRSFPRKRESRGRFNKPGPPPSAFALRRDQTAPKLAKRAWAGRGDERAGFASIASVCNAPNRG